MSGTLTPEVSQAIDLLQAARDAGSLSAAAVDNIRRWLTEPRYADYSEAVLHHIHEGMWKQLDDAFWTIIPFGTGGRRGRMYPIGSNAINERTIGESAQGLADYVIEALGADADLSCAIAYDVRHRSREFAELCSGIMAANGFKVYLLDDYRSTPQLSFAVRFKQCSCGIMVTASHNPPSDNAVKVYWSTGAQVLPPHDEEIIKRVLQCEEIRRVPFDDAVGDGRIEIVTAEVDEAYFAAVNECAIPGPRDLKVLFTPLHGVGALASLPVLRRDGFENVEVYAPHGNPDPDFSNVPAHTSNPENMAVFDEPIRYAQEHGHHLILATDPDADRLGVAAPLSLDTSGPWGTLSGNQIGALLADFILAHRAEAGTLTPRSYIVKTLVTTELIRSIAEQYGARCEGDLLVGFKNIAATMDKCGPDDFVFGTEESHGYLVGQHVRDKDAPVAAMLFSELAATLRAQKLTPHDRLNELFRRHGYHREALINLVMEGSEGMLKMKRLMAAFRQNPVRELAGIPVAAVRDYQSLTTRDLAKSGDEAVSPLVGPVGNLVMLDLAEPGNYVAVRPSGTEPKIKLYVFTKLDAESSRDLDAARQTLDRRLEQLEADVRTFAESHS